MKNIIVLVMLLFVVNFTLGFTVIAEATEAPNTIVWEVKMGDVTFNHVNHSVDTECAICHHTGGTVSCKTCHGVDETILGSKKAFHAQCKDCHKAQEVPVTKCRECHIK